MKQNARKKSNEETKKAGEQRKQGVWGMSKHSVTRREKHEDRKKAAAGSSKEADSEVIIMQHFDNAVVDEDIDDGALDAMALVEADDGTKEAEKEADAEKKNKVDDAKK